MSASTRCPTHPHFPVDDCPACDAKVEQMSARLDDDWQAEQDRYERWLDEIGGSG